MLQCARPHIAIYINLLNYKKEIQSKTFIRNMVGWKPSGRIKAIKPSGNNSALVKLLSNNLYCLIRYGTK